MADSNYSLTDFSGVARLFPLPDLVLFPHVVQPLHVFEPRYIDLLEDAMSGDRLIAMATFKPGWQKDYHDKPPLHPVICIGNILSHVKQDDGRYNILLAGMKRARVISERDDVRPFRIADVELVEDQYTKGGETHRRTLQKDLLAAFRGFVPEQLDADEHLEQLLTGQVSLGTLTDVVAYSLPMEIAQKLRLLFENNVDRRAEILLEHLQSLLCRSTDSPWRTFPPEFSSN